MSAISTGTAIAIAGAVGGASSIGGALIGAHGAESAAQTQAQAAQQAEALQQQQFQQEQANIAPYLTAGKGALSQLEAGLAPGGIFAQTSYPAFAPTGMATQALQPGAFAAPTAQQAAQQPGYQFAFDQGMQALQRSQAATGITGGGAAKGIEQYAQGLASTNYNNAYNQALSNYQTNQAAAQNALAGQSGLYGQQFNVQQQMLGNAYNRIAGLANTGANAVNQSNQAAQNYANQAGNLITSAGAAQAAGTMGAANAWAQGLGGLGNTAMNAALMNSLFGGQQNVNLPYTGEGAGYTGDYSSAVNSALAGVPGISTATPVNPGIAPTVGAAPYSPLMPYAPQVGSSYGGGPSLPPYV